MRPAPVRRFALALVLLAGCEAVPAHDVRSGPSVHPPPSAGPDVAISLAVAPPRADRTSIRMTNRSGDDLTYGLLVQLERWDGSRWTFVDHLGAATSDGRIEAGRRTAGFTFGVYDVGLYAEAHSRAAAQEVLLPADLPPGFYRLGTDVRLEGSGHEQLVYGRFEVQP